MTEPTYLGPIEEEKKNEPKYLGEIVQKEVTVPWSAKHPYLAAIPPTVWEVAKSTIPFVKYAGEEGRAELKGEFFPTGTTTDPEKLKEIEKGLVTGEKKISPYESLAKETMSAAEWVAFPTAIRTTGTIAKEVLPKIPIIGKPILKVATKEIKFPWTKVKPKIEEKPVDIESPPAEQSNLPTMNQKLKEKIAKEEIIEPQVVPKPEEPIFLGEIKPEVKVEVTPGVVVPKSVDIPNGWQTRVQPNWRKTPGWNAEVDWKNKAIVFESESDAKNIPIINHEIGHIRIEDKLGYVEKLSDSSFLEEYAKVMKAPQDMHINFIREHLAMDYGEYLTNPKKVTPKLTNLFEKYVPEPKVEPFKPTEPLPIEKVLPEAPPVKPEVVKPGEAGFVSLPTGQEIKDVGNKFYQRFFDRTWSIENASRKAKKLGAEILPGEDPEFLARTYLGNQSRWVQMIENRTFRVNPKGNVEFTGEGLKPILKEFAEANPFKNIDIAEKDLNNYLISKRYVADLQRPNIKGEIIAKPEQITWANQTLNELNTRYGNLDLFEQTGQRLYDFQKRVLNLLVDSGRLSEEQFTNIISKNPHYVPFERIFPEESVSTLSRGGLFRKTPQPVKRIKGSEKEISDAIESIMKQSYRILDIAERNKVTQSVALLEDTLPNIIKSVRIPMQKVATVDGEPVFRPSYFLKQNQVEYYIDGKRQLLEVSPLMAEAMGGLNELSSGILTKILSIPAQTLRIGATITPEFMFRNPIRDQFTASINTMIGFKPFVNAPEAIAQILGKGEVYQKWLSSGGAISTLNEMNRGALEKTVKELMGKRSLFKNLNVITKAQDLSQLFEMTTRVQAFKAGQRVGLSDIEAGYISREATLDFARRGTELKNWNRMTAFFNAGLQGTDKATRTFIENPIGATGKCLAEITIPSVVLFMANKDNPDYWEQPRWARRLFWLIPTGSKDVPFIRVPKPFLYGQVFGSLTEEFMDYALTQDKNAFRDFGSTMIDALSPSGGDPTSLFLPTAIKPIIENEVNWSFFRQRPIVPESKSKLLPFQQYSRFTSETSKDIGKELGVSPSKIENFFKGYLGGSGDYALQIADFLQGKKKPMEIKDYPLVKGFTVRPSEQVSQSLVDFYEDSDKILQIYNGYKYALKTGNKQDLNTIFSKFPNLWAVGNEIENLREKMNQVNLSLSQINDSNLPDEQKRNKTRTLEISKMEFAKKGNELIRKIQNNPSINNKLQIP